MGITVQHGPSMLPVGRLAYRTGQNEYINKRRKELEALAEQRAARQQKSQMQVNDINAGFQQIQMQHQQGMQRVAAQNEFQLDRDQKNQDWNVKAAGDLFNNQKALNDQAHQQGLARADFGQDLRNQAMIANNQAQDMAETIDRLYGTSNQAGRDKINQFQAQQIKLRGHIDKGMISQEQYDAQYSEAKSTLVNSLTGKNSELYQIGADLQVGGKKTIHGGAMLQVIGEGGAVTFERNYRVDPVTGEDMTPEEWSDEWEKIHYDGPDDKVGFHYEYGTDGTRRRESQEHLQKYTATNKVNMEAIKMLIEKQKAEAEAATKPLTKADALARLEQEGKMYDALNPEPPKEDSGMITDAWLDWQEKRQKAQQDGLSDEERAFFGLAPRLGGNSLLPTGDRKWPRESISGPFDPSRNTVLHEAVPAAPEAQKLDYLNEFSPQMMQ